MASHPSSGLDGRTQLAARAVLAAVLIGLALWTLQEFVVALVWAGILAIAVWPLFTRARRRFPRHGHDILLPAAFTLAVALLFIVPLGLAFYQAGREAHALLDWLHEIRTTGIAAPNWLPTLPLVGAWAAGWWTDNLANPDAAAALLHEANRSELIAAGRHLGVVLAHRTVLFIFALLTLFFLFRDGDALTAQILRAVHRLFGAGGERVAGQVVASVHGTVDGLVLVGLAEGFLLGIAYVAAGVPHPALLGLLTALGGMIPFGAPVVFGLAALLLLAQGAMTAAIVVVVLGVVVTFVADHFVRPALIGGATRMPFLLVLFGILGGVATWGLLGLFLGPAIIAAVTLLWREWTEPHTLPAAQEHGMPAARGGSERFRGGAEPRRQPTTR